jgi:hypothetical protein
MFGNRGQDRETFADVLGSSRGSPRRTDKPAICSPKWRCILDRMAQRDTETKETSEWKQETSEAAKFIRDPNQGLTEDDILEITDLVREHPSMGKMRPQERADYALYLFGNRHKGSATKRPSRTKSTAIPTGSAAGKPQRGQKARLLWNINKLGDRETLER